MCVCYVCVCYVCVCVCVCDVCIVCVCVCYVCVCVMCAQYSIICLPPSCSRRVTHALMYAYTELYMLPPPSYLLPCAVLGLPGKPVATH